MVRSQPIQYVTSAAWMLIILLAVSTQTLHAADNGKKKLAPDAGRQEWSGDLAPITAIEWSHNRAAHLLERAGLGGTPQEIDRLAAMTPEQAVQWLVQYQAVENDHLLPFDESGIFDPPVEPFPKSRADAVRIARATGEAMGVKPKPSGDRPLQPVVDRFFYWLRADRLEVWRAQQWWAKRMLTTNRPLEEKLALFWHGHFATSDDKLRDYRKSLKQLALFRTAGNGNFRDLLIGVAKDPAMLVYLDAGENIKGSPNENFSREILELFTMGVGNYTEKDIREAARAFTGWTNDSLTFVVKPELHDEGEKTFLGQTGNFDGIDIINIVLEQDVTARFIATKLYQYFVHADPSPQLVMQLGKQFKEENYDIATLLHTIFLSRDFYSSRVYGTQIKSPVHLVVSTYRKLGLTDIPGIPDFNTATRNLGQELFHPPNVAGWEGGRSWITPALLLERGNFAREILFPDIANFKAPDQQMPEQNRKVAVKIARGVEITQATLEGESNSMESTGLDGARMDANSMNDESLSSASNMSTFNKMAGADEDYNTRYGSTHGWMEAFRRVKPVPRHAAQLNAAGMITDANLATPTEVVDYFLERLLRTPVSGEDRAALIAFLTQELGTDQIDQTVTYLEEPARLLLHLIMSTPEYQLG